MSKQSRELKHLLESQTTNLPTRRARQPSFFRDVEQNDLQSKNNVQPKTKVTVKNPTPQGPVRQSRQKPQPKTKTPPPSASSTKSSGSVSQPKVVTSNLSLKDIEYIQRIIQNGSSQAIRELDKKVSILSDKLDKVLLLIDKKDVSKKKF